MNDAPFLQTSPDTERVIAVLRRVGEIWSDRLAGGWEPPSGSGFPWAQVRFSLEALVAGMENLAHRLSTPATEPSPPYPLSRFAGRGGVMQGAGRSIEGAGEFVLGGASGEIVRRARELRGTATTAEALLWDLVRDRRLDGLKFRRQHPIGKFITDFYCDTAKLIIELDGGIHSEPEQQERDEERERILQLNPYRVLRFTNEQVFQETETTLTTIHQAATKSAAPVSPLAPPSPSEAGEGGRGGEGKTKAATEGRGNADNNVPNTQHPTPNTASTAALILAGNTPLMSWSPLCACLLAGWHVKVKMSRDETLWPRLFWETLNEADAEVAARVTLDVWPGDAPRTTELIQSADAVIAFGSNQTLARLRTLTPEGTPFFGFGHAVSIGICTRDGVAQAGNFARDILMYNQEGCLSAQVILVEDSGDGKEAAEVANVLQAQLAVEVDTLQVLPVVDEATAHRIRSARDMALFAGDVQVIATDDLRWTILLHTKPTAIEFPQGHGIVQVIPFPSYAETLTEQFGAVRDYISSVGVAGTLFPNLEHALRQETSISRICPAGEMQTPPLDWPNGNIDLFNELLAH